MSKSDCNPSTFLMKWVMVRPGACWGAPLGGYQGAAKASRRYALSNVPGSSPGRTCLEHFPEEMSGIYPGHMPTWLQLAPLDLKEQKAPTLSYFWMAELLALSICMNPGTLQENSGHLYLQTCYFGAYLPSASRTRANALCHLNPSCF